MQHWYDKHPEQRPRLGTLIRSLICAAALLASTGCATYRFGNASLYRPDVRTVYVPMIENTTYRRHLGEQLTEAIVKEIELKTPYKVVHTPGADSVLRGTVVSEHKNVLSEDINDNPRDIEFVLGFRFHWTDAAGNSLMRPYTVPVADDFLSVTQAASFVPEAGQSVATARFLGLERIANQVVGEMESPW
ncbi:MAG: hypothetical protein CL681_20960 [Blastopirellula sp.]|nr:hypothetical protein [Blastopirellula sp.]